MNYEKFKDKVVEDVRRELETRTGKSYDVQAHTVEKMNENYDTIKDYDQMKATLSMEVVSAGRNAELLDKVPHKDLEDMAVVYRFVVGDSENGRGSILITNQLLDSYGISAEQLHEDALKYAPVMRPAVIQTMTETLLEMMGPDARDMIPVLPNNGKLRVM